MADNQYDVIIIGAGWYGLIAATTYLRLAPGTKLLVLDDGKTIGGVWNLERIYPDLFAQVGHGLFEYSFYPMKKEGLSPARYISGGTIHNYLNDFARDQGLVDRIQLNTKVVKVERRTAAKTDGWHITANLTQAEAPAVANVNVNYYATKLIVASGVTSEPYVPDFPRTRFTKPIIHSSELGTSLGALRAGGKTERVVVLGAAKSAYDTVFHLLKSGKRVDWVIREDGTGPLAIAPPKLLGLFNSVDLMATRILGALSPAILQTEGFWYWFLQRSSVGRAITQVFWRNLSRVAEIHAGYHRTENSRKLTPVPLNYAIFWANSGLGLASVPDFWKTFHKGDCHVHRTSIESFTNEQVVLGDGTRIDTDYVILCTGWKDGFSPYSPELRGELGLPSPVDHGGSWAKLDAEASTRVDELLPNLTSIPHETPQSIEHKEISHRPWRLYRRLVSPTLADAGDRSVLVLGQIHSVYTPLVAEMQALWGSAYLLSHIDMPSVEKMRQEVAVWNAWTAKRYLAQGRRHAYSIYDYLAYIDTLARDLGIRTARKGNAIAEMFATYRPRDYNGLIDEYLLARRTRGTIAQKTPLLQKAGAGASPYGSGRMVKYLMLMLIGMVVLLVSVL